MCAVFFLQYLDKTSIGYAAIFGMRTDTHLKGQEYSWLTTLFFLGKEKLLRSHPAHMILDSGLLTLDTDDSFPSQANLSPSIHSSIFSHDFLWPNLLD